MKSQRDALFDALYDKHDDRIIVVSADCGAPALDRWKGTNQFINVGIAEQNMVAIAMGLALSGKRPYCYGITPFVTLRCLDQIRLACMMNLPITIVSIGVGFSYYESGPTHHGIEDIGVMRLMPNMRIASPANSQDAQSLAKVYDAPTYIRLDRGDNLEYIPHLIIKGEHPSTYYPLWLKPFFLPRGYGDIEEITVVEEHLTGGLGTIVSEYLEEHSLKIPLKRVHIRDQYSYFYGREKLRKESLK